MSYQVLARKWRPRTFAELVGQEHVLRALVNALDNDRLHHAYLFTGTRGVGKTTIARIFARSLNCEQGISATPCDVCSPCVEISEGRFVDLIEVDAASRTKVEDTRELLENVQYRPTRGRYKVYLIDEVHMLSGHSFNALLKTLEEPPPHVKFLLATTDPQKLPVTILSRCLQFNLKHLGVERISDHLQHVLSAEKVPFEEAALHALARAAEGSMRDALSLTDQAIAYGDGQVNEAEVDAMLGTINRREVQELCRAVAARDAAQMLAVSGRMAEFSPDYGQALGEILATWHRVAIAQQVPDAVDNSLGDQQLVMELAATVAPEDVQLFYQIGLLGRRDLPYAADPRSGFEMVLLRQLAFQPQGVMPPTTPPPERQAVPQASETPVGVHSVSEQAAVPDSSASGLGSHNEAMDDVGAPPWVDEASEDAGVPRADEPSEASVGVPSVSEQAAAPYSSASGLGSHNEAVDDAGARPWARPWADEASEDAGAPRTDEPSEASVGAHSVSEPAELWHNLFPQLPLGGILQNTASNLALTQQEDGHWHFVIDGEQSALYEEEHQQRLAEVLTSHLGSPQQVRIDAGKLPAETPAQRTLRIREERRCAAVATLRQDPLVAELLTRFNGQLLEQTITPREA